MDLKKLSEPFTDDDLEWRISQVFNNANLSARILVYVTNRAIMNRLDDVCGPENWKNEYTQMPGAFLCGLSIKVGAEWVTKWDGAQESQIEATKGGLSGAMKRAAVQWGIGRYLYNIGDCWANIHDKGEHYQAGKKGDYAPFKWDAPKLNGGTGTNTPTTSHKTQQSGSQGTSGAQNCISEAQGKRLFAIAKEAGTTPDDIFAKFGVSRLGEIKKSDYEAVCQWAEVGRLEEMTRGVMEEPF